MEALIIDIQADLAEGELTVVARGESALSMATVRRSPQAEVQGHIPVGTRDPDHLTMLLDGSPVELSPGPGRYTRGSYRVVARHAGVRYELVPDDHSSSRLVRDGKEIGSFHRAKDGEVHARWSPGVTVGPVDAAMGCALAASFGTGARGFVGLILEGLFGGPSNASPV